MKIAVVGSGNVATTFAKAIFRTEDHQLVQVYARNSKSGKSLAKLVNAQSISSIDQLRPDLDVCILAVSDNAIEEVNAKLPTNHKTLVVHCSGAIPNQVLHKHPEYGSLYPLYSFPNKRRSSLQNIPILYDGNTEAAQNKIQELASALSQDIHFIEDEQRLYFHLAAVFANNFSNHMMTRAFGYIQEKKLNPNILLPIIKQSSQMWIQGQAKNIQTGPAIRHDQKTIKKHQSILSSENHELDLYNFLTHVIQAYYKK